jgi:hypothetical protein
MADVTGSVGTSSNTFDWGQGLFSLGNTIATGYFASQATKNALKAPPANTAIVVGGLVAVAVVLLVAFKM